MNTSENTRNNNTETINLFKVNKKMWNKWTEVGRYTFNNVYEDMTSGPELFCNHSGLYYLGWNGEFRKVGDEDYKVLAWNAAFIAADYASKKDKALYGKR